MVLIDHKFIGAYPARAVRRDEAADQPGAGAGHRAAAGAAGRADHRAGRGGPARDPGERPPAAARARIRRAVHQPRHRHGARPVRPDPGDVRAARSSRSSPPTRCSATRCTRTARAAGVLRRPAGRDRPDHLRPGPATGPVQPARGLLVRAAVPGEDRAVHHDRAAAGAAGRRSGRLPRRRAPAQSGGGSTARRGRPDHPGVRRPAVRQVGGRVGGRAAAASSLLTVEDVSKTFVQRRGTEGDPDRGGQGRELRAAPGRGDRAGRPERQRQVHPGPDDHRGRQPDHRHDHLPRARRRPGGRRAARAAAARLPQRTCRWCSRTRTRR